MVRFDSCTHPREASTLSKSTCALNDRMTAPKLPDFDDLPKVEGMPKGCIWGLFDKSGKKDVFGTVNLLTPEVVKAAYAEAKDGISVSLKFVAWKHNDALCSLSKSDFP